MSGSLAVGHNPNPEGWVLSGDSGNARRFREAAGSGFDLSSGITPLECPGPVHNVPRKAGPGNARWTWWPEWKAGFRVSGAMIHPGGLGTYRVDGRLTRETFVAGYRSASDRGTMELRRPPPP